MIESSVGSPADRAERRALRRDVAVQPEPGHGERRRHRDPGGLRGQPWGGRLGVRRGGEQVAQPPGLRREHDVRRGEAAVVGLDPPPVSARPVPAPGPGSRCARRPRACPGTRRTAPRCRSGSRCRARRSRCPRGCRGSSSGTSRSARRPTAPPAGRRTSGRTPRTASPGRGPTCPGRPGTPRRACRRTGRWCAPGRRPAARRPARCRSRTGRAGRGWGSGRTGRAGSGAARPAGR